MKAQSVAFDGRHPEPANVNELGLVRLTVVEEFFAEKTENLGMLTLSVANCCPSCRAWCCEKSDAKSKKVARHFEFFWYRLAALRDSRTTFAIQKQ